MKILRFFAALIFSFGFSFGLVIIANSFQIYSYRRFIIISIWLAPFVLMAFWLLFRYLLAPVSILKNNSVRIQIVWLLFFSILASLLFIPPSADLIRYLVTLVAVSLTFITLAVLPLLLLARDNEKYLTKAALIYLALVGVLGFSLFLFMGRFVRMYGDDFCYQNLVLTRGYLSTVAYFYFNWSGRLLSGIIAFAIMNGPTGLLLQIGLPALSFGLCAYVFSKDYLKTFERIAWIIVAATMLPFLIYALAPDPYKSIYWILAASGYLPLLVLFPPYFLWIYHSWRKENSNSLFLIIIGAGLAFLLTIVHEVASLPVVALNGFILLMLFMNKVKDRSRWTRFTIALAASLVGSAVAILAPGNFARQVAQAYPPSPGLLTLLRLNSSFTIEFLKLILAEQRWLLLITAFFVGYLGPKPVEKGKWYPLFALALAGLMVWLSFLSGTYAAQAQVPPRVQIIPTMFLVGGFFFAGLSVVARPVQPVLLAALTIFVLVSLFAFNDLLVEKYTLVEPIIRYSQDWDRRDQLLRTTDTAPYKISIPWDAWEQEFGCTIEYYKIVKSER